MPRVRGDKDYLFPVNGLNTESSPLNFPEQSAVDLLNVQVDFDPLRLKVRNGLKVEAAGSTGTLALGGVPLAPVDAFTAYRWDNVDNDSTKSFIVVQLGKKLYFNDATAADVSGARQTFYIDLTTLKSGTAEGTDALAASTRVQFQEVKGRLMIVSRAIEPTLLSYDSSVPTVQANKLTLQIRDTLGVDDSLAVDERPNSLSQEHEYNLYNQGWHQQRKAAVGGAYVDPIATFHTAHSVYPSNADIVWVGMVDNEAELIFDPDVLKDQTFGSSPSAKGHYVVDAFDIDRETYRGAPTTGTGSYGGSGGIGGGAGGIIYTPAPTEAL